MEALLRSEIQHEGETIFIFGGSQTLLLLAIFNEYSRPFYNSAQTLYLIKIDRNEYAGFIQNHFKNDEIKIDIEVTKHIYDLGNGITYNVQFLCNKLFSLREKVLDKIVANNSLKEKIKENEITYYNYRELLTYF